MECELHRRDMLNYRAGIEERVADICDEMCSKIDQNRLLMRKELHTKPETLQRSISTTEQFLEMQCMKTRLHKKLEKQVSRLVQQELTSSDLEMELASAVHQLRKAGIQHNMRLIFDNAPKFLDKFAVCNFLQESSVPDPSAAIEPEEAERGHNETEYNENSTELIASSSRHSRCNATNNNDIVPEMVTAPSDSDNQTYDPSSPHAAYDSNAAVDAGEANPAGKSTSKQGAGTPSDTSAKQGGLFGRLSSEMQKNVLGPVDELLNEAKGGKDGDKSPLLPKAPNSMALAGAVPGGQAMVAKQCCFMVCPCLK